MFNTTNNNTDMKREWQTYYLPELVGEYLSEINAPIEMDTVNLSAAIGSVYPTREASLEDFLMWCYRREQEMLRNQMPLTQEMLGDSP